MRSKVSSRVLDSLRHSGDACDPVLVSSRWLPAVAIQQHDFWFQLLQVSHKS